MYSFHARVWMGVNYASHVLRMIYVTMSSDIPQTLHEDLTRDKVSFHETFNQLSQLLGNSGRHHMPKDHPLP